MLGRPEALVFGGHGMLGRAVVRELRERGGAVQVPRIPWANPQDAEATVRAAIADALARPGRLQIWWCAGAGVTATAREALEAELGLIGAFAESVRGGAVDRADAVAVFFASSAGGVYGGSVGPPFDEETTPRPLGAYGDAKLRAEALLSQLAASGVRVAIARIANIFGPGQDLAKPQGLISQLFLSYETGRPLNLYVSLDTMRDYIHVDDAARVCVAFLDAVADGPALATVKVIASGRAVTIGGLLSEVRRICRRRPPLVLAASPQGGQQARDLRLRSVVFTQLDAVAHRTLGSGMATVRRDIEAQVASGAVRR